MEQKTNTFKINYLFFGFPLLFLVATSICNICLVEKILEGTRLFFIVYAIGQAIFEYAIFIILANVIEKFLPRWIFFTFISICFLFFITHLVDFILLRILDLPFWDALSICLEETWSNFLEMLILSGLPLSVWAILFSFTLFLPFIGMLAYKLSDKLIKRKHLYIKTTHFIYIFICSPMSLFLWDYIASPIINPDIYLSYEKSLPWKATFVKEKIRTIPLSTSLQKLVSEKHAKKTIKNLHLTPLHKPNIYLFVVESLRKDFITEEIAPHLHDFKTKKISFNTSLANANNTQNSWFSIFHSNLPYYWTHAKDSKNQLGSLPLKVLKDSGYKINVYTSAQLAYYGMKEVLFGKDLYLADHYHDLQQSGTKEAHINDKKAINMIASTLKNKENQEGNVFIIFFDSTHFNYCWAQDHEIKFKPILDEFSILFTSPSKWNIELLINRYKNSINYVDSLFNSFVQTLKKQNLYDDSVIVFLGDHGEEFYEHGHLYHASDLSNIQTSVPIYYKFGENDFSIDTQMTSHMEVFPSILDYIFGKNPIANLMHGESIFNKEKWPYIVTARYNGSRTPFEFFIHNGKEKLTLRFNKRSNIYKSTSLEVLSIKNIDDNTKLLPPGSINIKEFKPAIDKMLKSN